MSAPAICLSPPMSTTTTIYQEVPPVPSPYHAPPPPSREEQPVSSPWKFMGALSSNMLLVGYVVMPLAFGDQDSTHVNKVNTCVAASVLIAVAYALSFILACFQYDQRSYLLHSVFLPCFVSNLIGALNVLLNILCRDLLPFNRLEVVSLSLPCGFTFVYAFCAVWMWGYDVLDGSLEQSTPLLSEEEQQRQQFYRLLQADSSKKRHSRKSMRSSFHQVHVPEHINPGKGWNTFMPSPSPREEGYYS